MDEERHEVEERLAEEIESMAASLIRRCQDARFYQGTEKQRALLDALQKFFGD